MKLNLSLKYSALALVMLLANTLLAKDQSEKKKYVEKSYKVSSSTQLSISNKFGKVEINSWEKSEFSIKIEIVGKGRNDERAQDIIDAIDIDIDESSSEISFKTNIDNIKNKNGEGFEVNYTIHMPEANDLMVKNSFGDVAMGNRGGNLEADVSYGSLKIGDVGGKIDLKLSFGSGSSSIGQIQKGDMEVKYSKLEIEAAGKLDLEQGFSDVEIGRVDDLELESKYGSMEIEKAGKIIADAHFSSFEIEELTGMLELDCSYLGDFTIERLATSFTLVDIDGKFGSYDIGLAEGLNANIDAEFSFADLKISSDVDATFSYRVKESNKSHYKGKIGKGDPNKIIRIDSGYGSLRLKTD